MDAKLSSHNTRGDNSVVCHSIISIFSELKGLSHIDDTVISLVVYQLSSVNTATVKLCSADGIHLLTLLYRF